MLMFKLEREKEKKFDCAYNKEGTEERRERGVGPSMASALAGEGRGRHANHEKEAPLYRWRRSRPREPFLSSFYCRRRPGTDQT